MAGSRCGGRWYTSPGTMGRRWGSKGLWEATGSDTGDLAGTLSLGVGVMTLFLSWDTAFPELMPPLVGRSEEKTQVWVSCMFATSSTGK